VRQDRINAAMLLSLRARIPNTRQINVSSQCGIVVLEASRTPEDSLPAATMVEMAFTTLAAAWPLISRANSQEDQDGILDDLSRHLDGQLSILESMSKQIDDVDRQGASLQRVARKLHANRLALVNNTSQIRQRYPSLTPEPVVEPFSYHTPSGDPLDSSEGQVLMAAVALFHTKNKRYPVTAAALSKAVEVSEEVLDFVSRVPNVFEAAKERVRKTLSRKRARCGDDAPEIAAGQPGEEEGGGSPQSAQGSGEAP